MQIKDTDKQSNRIIKNDTNTIYVMLIYVSFFDYLLVKTYYNVVKIHISNIKVINI